MNKAFEIILSWLHKRLDFHENRMAELGGTERDVEDWGSVKAYSDVIDIVEKVAEEYKGGWIPCSEMLPDVEADVLLSLRSLDVHTGFMSNTEGYFYVDGEGYVEFENVPAWQPLPEPFKERD